ncbi:MAG TPA: hypothetical protein DCS48_04325 [Desulfovibrio sp.]|nr:hypothetical protein [Desulfovibrio sp.]
MNTKIYAYGQMHKYKRLPRISFQILSDFVTEIMQNYNVKILKALLKKLFMRYFSVKVLKTKPHSY